MKPNETYRRCIRALPCVLLGKRVRIRDHPEAWETHECFGAVQACHVKTRGAGGGDVGNLYPGCVRAHGSQHFIGIRSFQERWQINLTEIAAKLGEQWKGGGNVMDEAGSE